VGAYEVIAFQTSPGAMAALFMDIGPRVQTEEQLRRVRHAFEHAGDAFFWIDAEGRVIEFNIEVCRSLGYTREEMLGLSISDFVPHIPQGAWGARWADIKKQGLTRSETHHRRKDGSIFPVELVAFHVDFAGREMIFGIARDITERKRAEEARSHIDAQLRQQQKIEAIGTLAAGVAHEINNPMNAVINYAQLIHNRLPEDSPLRGYAGHIISESERVSEIVRQLLAFSRHDKQSHSPARIQDIVKNTLLLTQAMLRKSQIELEVDVPDDLPSLKCHSQQIQQILLNLITNAVAAIDEQRARVERAMFIRVASRRVDEGGRAYCRTTVSDNGAGIPREIAERIFEPFYATKSRERGTGLGLSISYGIAQDHGGRLWCESDPGEGSRFHLDLPLNNGGSLAVNDAQG
jgi:PAS domain S-box-containing protein